MYNVGFAIHDDNITTGGHQVSFVKGTSLRRLFFALNCLNLTIFNIPYER